MVMRAVAMVRRGRARRAGRRPAALAGNLCRCTGYEGIVEAVCEGWRCCARPAPEQERGMMPSSTCAPASRRRCGRSGCARTRTRSCWPAGQTLLAAMRLGLSAPLGADRPAGPARAAGHPAARAICCIGAMCTHASDRGIPLVRRASARLRGWPAGIADAQIRVRGTIGGSVANADPAACWPAGLLAADARFETDRREIAADDFFAGLFTTALASRTRCCGPCTCRAARACTT
jgi:xanthine dehydrogenase iron-sulfur cluster and FAD-binding subunit A